MLCKLLLNPNSKISLWQFCPFWGPKKNRLGDCERMWAICSYHSFKKSNCKQITLVALNKRATVSDSLRSVMKKEQPWSNHSLRKSCVSDLLMILCSNRSQKTSNSLKKTYFLYVFDSFSLFLCPRANWFCHSSLRHSFVKSDCERFVHVAHDIKLTGAICSFSQANRYFPLFLTKN